VSVAAPTRSPEVLARRNGTCASTSCEEPIVAGDSYIAKVPGKGWMHGQCAAEHDRLQAVRDSYQEDAA
jgi:hypothetical protein